MAWTSPMTATANTAFTAAQFNTHVRDNLLETAPAKATTAGRWMVTTGANAIAERAISSHTVTTAQTTTSTTYTDLTTEGPHVTLTTGARALVWWAVQIENSSASTSTRATIDVSGATTIAPSDSHDLYIDGLAANNALRACAVQMFDTLTPGSNKFKVQYKVGGGTGTFRDRTLLVMAL